MKTIEEILHGNQIVSSRDYATATNRNHHNVCYKIRHLIKALDKAKVTNKYFIASSFVDDRNRQQFAWNITAKGQLLLTLSYEKPLPLDLMVMLIERADYASNK